MKFQYTALTKDNKKIAGVFDVENEAAAQEELHKMGVAILSIKEITEDEYAKLKVEEEAVKEKKGIQTYTFVAIDPNGKEVEGTIDAVDEYSAYKRMRTEYQFTVNNLYAAGATPQQVEQAKTVLEPLEARLQQELEAAPKEEGRGRGRESIESEEEVNEEIIAEVDKVIINTKKAMKEHGELFSNDLLREIESTLGELERVRTSNNIKHITEISNNLYTLISNPDKAEGEAENTQYQSLIGEIQDSALVKKEFDLYKKAVKISGLKKLFAQIAKKLKQETKEEEGEVKPPTGIGKLKAKLQGVFEKLSKKKPPKLVKEKKPKGKIGQFADKVGAYFKATSPVLKKTRQKEMMKALKELFKKEAPERAETEAAEEGVAAPKAADGKRDFTNLFVEIDSFIGWLLCFYLIYFFLVSFSLEKNVGINKEFIFRTLKSPLLLNITIFLLILHFTLRLKNLHFRRNVFATLFLLFFSLGIYALIIVNF